jgi:RNA polymerase sigma factor (sigma-70 family)
VDLIGCPRALRGRCWYPQFGMLDFERVDDMVRSVVVEKVEPALPRHDSGIDVLYARHWTELCHYIRRQFGVGPPDPEDVVQETFIKFAALENRHTIDNPRAYLYRTAHNLLIDERRRLTLRNKIAGGIEALSISDDRTPERVLVGRERLDVLTRTLLAMSEARRRSFLLNRLHGLSAAAIARMTGYSESAVKKHIGLALSELEAALTAGERATASRST